MDFGLLICMFVIHAVTANPSSSDLSQEWGDFKTVFNKTYQDEMEEAFRNSVWKENVQKINQHNLEADLGMHSYRLKMNHFGDMTTDEINRVVNNHMPELSYSDTIDTVQDDGMESNTRSRIGQPEDDVLYRKLTNLTGTLGARVPDRIDWRKKGYVTPVKNQIKRGHRCGSCYAFAATGALEGQHFRKTGRLVSLSEQNIVDCTYHNKYKNLGCKGGWVKRSFRYIIDNGGVDTESSYPYKAKVGTCKYNPRNVGAKATSYRDILPRGDETKLKDAVGTIGPVSVCIDARSYRFHYYSSGVYNNQACSRRRLTHAMLAVGYDRNEDGQDYWIVKNSYGTRWGENGYVKMSRNKHNQCGIATRAGYPLV